MACRVGLQRRQQDSSTGPRGEVERGEEGSRLPLCPSYLAVAPSPSLVQSPMALAAGTSPLSPSICVCVCVCVCVLSLRGWGMKERGKGGKG